MKILIAPDSFKGTLRANKVCQIWREALEAELPGTEILTLPMADGGEGSLEAVLEATGAERREVPVTDPLGRPVPAAYARLDHNHAFVETAAACGLELLSSKERNPMKATSYGAGQLLRAAIEDGATEITLGIGGSATVDGGLGLLQALGFRFQTKNGQEAGGGGAILAELATCDASEALPALRNVSLRIASDVTSPLLGPQGAAAVFGPQKGATPEMVSLLEAGLANFAAVLKRSGLADSCDAPGDGAAGGLGFALRAVLHGKSASGARLIADLVGLSEHLQEADLLITGEGCSDSQTLCGKLPFVLADLASRQGVPCLLCSGAVLEPALLAKHFTAVFSTIPALRPLDETLKNARENLSATAHAIAATLQIGRK